jgi:prepilin-type N-terminal cleavage/methylation domain-containing protein
MLKTMTTTRNRASGFSLLEMLMVCALICIIATISFVSMIPIVKQQHVVNAYNTTIAAMRLARDNAVAQRTTYSVTFQNSSVPNTIVVAPVLPTGGSAFTGQQSSQTYQLPTDTTFLAQSGLPASQSTAPDNYYSTSLLSIDLGYTANGGTGGSSTVYFCPDGSAQDAEDGTGNCSGSWDGGVVYISQSGNILSSRAVTLWGGTGRIRGWRLYNKSGGGYQWLRQ